jgi:single-strand DNA-binding protein
MTDINSVILVGRLTRDMEMKYLPGTNTALGNISLAVNRSAKKDDEWKDEVSYFDITVWGKQAEGLQKYLIKGKQIGVEGELIQERWEKEGQQHSRVKVTARKIQLLSDPRNSGTTTNAPPPQENNYADDIPF